MWYVIQTLKGQEEKHKNYICRDIAALGEEVFIMENELPYRIKGEWIKDKKPLFPGYIFVETGEPEDFNKRLRKGHVKLKLIETDGVITPILPEEEEYLRTLGGDDHTVRYSEGYRIGDKVEIISGAFTGYTGEIKKLDRHNRRAKLLLSLMGRDVEVEIGLGILKSS